MLDILLHISPVAKILLLFGLILAGSRVRVPLGLALVIGGLLVDLWAGRSPGAVWTDLGRSLAKAELWLLVLNIILVIELGYYLSHPPNSAAILALARRLGGRHGRTLGLILIPAILGLVPMPGGALFSAPLVGETLRDKEFPAPWKAAVNYWFRHIFEYWWPLYPVVIVTLSMVSLKSWQFFALQIPFTLVSLTVGWFVLLRRHVHALADEVRPARQDSSRLLAVLLPLALVVLATLLLPPVVKAVLPGGSQTMTTLLAMLAGLVFSLLLIARTARDDREFRLFSHLLSGKTADVVFTLGGVLVFQAMLDASGLLPQAGRELRDSMVPIEIVVAFLPFLAGLVTGIAIGFAGPAFPLVLGLAAVDPHLTQASALVLAFGMGYAGMMLSPVHLCYVLTRRYFISGLFSSYVYIVPCTLVIAGWGIVMHLLLRLLGW